LKKFRHLLAEFAGTCALLCAVIGSGIMAEQLSQGNTAVALLANTLVTVFALYVLIETLGPISGAHFNPLVTVFFSLVEKWTWTFTVLAVICQLAGAVAGAWLAHAMFDLNIWQLSTKVRTGYGQWVAEAVATAGLMTVILLSPKNKSSSLVASYIGAAYWFTASTSFANPAAVLGRMMSDTFAGISPHDAPAFVAAEITGIGFVFIIYNNLYNFNLFM
jgi:glycerol uptake facilitator-like aquaporin